jgi:predicted flap endonuclease-1-like 5' DNA nuclease
MASYPIISIEGVGPINAEKLKKVGITTTDKLLERGKDPKGRKELAASAEIDESRILKWANMADLMRVKGIGEEFSELLEAAGVDTVKELRHRSSTNLAKALIEINEMRKLVRAVPPESVVATWIEQAKGLDPIMVY